MFRTSIKVRFSDEDHAQVVYFPRFFHFFHTVFEDFFESEGLPYHLAFKEGLAWPAVHARCDFLVPLRFGERLDVELGVLRVGKSSLSLAYHAWVGERLCARAQLVVVCIDLSSFRPLPIPNKYRAIFEKHLVEGEVAEGLGQSPGKL
ncbi:MAG: acyl-CoA thioesterase [Sandaracinaceae bacterium]|nr:acyl-CoA thioesterase [Sandaracinaceae bacterium]